MKKVLLILMANGLFATSNLTTTSRVENVTHYALGHLWTYLQGGRYFSSLMLILLIAVLAAFAMHYMVIGPKQFSHDGKKIYAFSLLERSFHFVAALSWIILIPTGLVIMFGTSFPAGMVRTAKTLHIFAMFIFIVSWVPMFLCWFKSMLPSSYDLKWLMIAGGYLSKTKKPVPAGKFNFGQKMWYYIACFGGFVMIATGMIMYMLDFNSNSLQSLFGLSHIDILRMSAIIHNVLAVACVVMFCVHVYMAVFAIKGSIHSMKTGYKEEEEVYILHSYWYKDLVSKNKINPTYKYND